MPELSKLPEAAHAGSLGEQENVQLRRMREELQFHVLSAKAQADRTHRREAVCLL